MTPLVSVLMPVFNAADTLLIALASLQAQTYGNWECIVVDDGSTDNSMAIVESLHDKRIQSHRLSGNRGRGHARQQALRFARGSYVTFLDGDDWICPTKFREQVEVLAAHPGIAVVSTDMAIVNRLGQLAGIRNSFGSKSGSNDTFWPLGMPPMPFAPSMMAAKLAKQTGFDTSFPISEDVDFLLRAVLGKRYVVLSTPLYVYREQGSTTITKVSAALNYCCRMFNKYFDQCPVDCAIEIAKARAKQAIYHVGAAVGCWDQIIARRSRTPSAAELQQYLDSWKTVTEIANGAAGVSLVMQSK